MRSSHSLLALLGLTAPVFSRPTKVSKEYIDWRTFHGYGANLGGWLEQESTIDTYWWDKECEGGTDLCDLGEWGLCEYLGSECPSVFEQRYATYITTADIDKLASAGVSVLRIPTTYAAWIDFPGSQFYHGNQQHYLREIATYAIEQYDMHILVDIHSLPGGTNGLDIGEATGHWGWWWNETNLEWSMRAVDAVIDFVQNSGYPQSYTIEPINEPADNHNFSDFGTAAALSDHGAVWLLKYINLVIDHVEKVNPKIPVMFQGSFKTEMYWSPHFKKGTNLVFDLHHYYHQYDNSTSLNVPEFICADAKVSAGDGKFPTFVGEWAIQTGANNSLALRERNLKAGISAFGQYTRGCSYWTAKYFSNTTVEGEGDMQDYWNFESFIDMGFFKGQVEIPNFCS
ncbi:hypothetical protein N7488_012144 [Penicillium malachiteum]|nr:hypothetical protein N7488_012144 [Penicillium malachiteum]